MSGSQQCESLFFAFGGKEKRLREKAAQNPQISEKTSLLVKKTLKNLQMSEKSSKFAAFLDKGVYYSHCKHDFESSSHI